MTFIVLTGATSGIGLALARRLSTTDILVLQGPEEHRPKGLDDAHRAHYLAADFTDLSNVRALASNILDLGVPDVLVNNAGIPGPSTFTRSSEGVERTFQVNYLAGALLTDLLLDEMTESARIVNTASATHYSGSLLLDDLDFAEQRYSAIAAYARSKLAVVTATRSLAQRIPQLVLSVHPGVISTNLLHAMFGSGGSSVEDGATNLLSAISAEVPTGTYLDETTPAYPNPAADDPTLQERLRSVTSQLVDRQIR
jgi:NAD(P)-dependent dehydrogenase (short-subunit alcohol dehydrogenase family)